MQQRKLRMIATKTKEVSSTNIRISFNYLHHNQFLFIFSGKLVLSRRRKTLEFFLLSLSCHKNGNENFFLLPNSSSFVPELVPVLQKQEKSCSKDSLKILRNYTSALSCTEFRENFIVNKSEIATVFSKVFRLIQFSLEWRIASS